MIYRLPFDGNRAFASLKRPLFEAGRLDIRSCPLGNLIKVCPTDKGRFFCPKRCLRWVNYGREFVGSRENSKTLILPTSLHQWLNSL